MVRTRGGQWDVPRNKKSCKSGGSKRKINNRWPAIALKGEPCVDAGSIKERKAHVGGSREVREGNQRLHWAIFPGRIRHRVVDVKVPYHKRGEGGGDESLFWCDGPCRWGRPYPTIEVNYSKFG